MINHLVQNLRMVVGMSILSSSTWCGVQSTGSRWDIETEFKRQHQLVMDELPGTIMEMEVMPDHVHLLVDCSPQFFILDAIKRLKGQTAKKLFELFPDIKKSLWGGQLWNPSYRAVSVSDRSIKRVKQYIREQKTKR